MTSSPVTAGLTRPPNDPEQARRLLGFETLTRLADQFARNPSLQSLTDSALLSVAGQFGVANAALVVRCSDLGKTEAVYSAIGKCRSAHACQESTAAVLRVADGVAGSDPIALESLKECDDAASVRQWQDGGLVLMVPLAIHGSTFGALLLGHRVGDRKFSDVDLQMLQHFVASITPLLANSVLYADMTALNERHRQILDSVRQAIFVFDSTGLLVTVNRAGEVLIGAPDDSGNKKSFIGAAKEAVFPEETYPGWSERLREAESGSAHRIPSTMIAKTPDGERAFSVSVRNNVPISGSQLGMIVTVDDKTEEVNNERRMFELEKFAERGVMASSIAHELNNHLAMIMGGIELAGIALKKDNKEKLGSTLEKLRDGVTRMERFTAGLMDYARINPQKQPAAINDIISDVLSFAAAQKRFSSIKLGTNLSPELPTISLDRDQIAQVVINILNNAADAIVETGRRDGVILVTTDLDADSIMVRISDNGKGMTPEVRGKLFKMHLTTKPDGHGFGLTTCAKILDHHNASVEIDSRVGFGTTFEFRFPLIK